MVMNEAYRVRIRHGELNFLEGAKGRIKITDLCIEGDIDQINRPLTQGLIILSLPVGIA
jgi:hypothetical protein